MLLNIDNYLVGASYTSKRLVDLPIILDLKKHYPVFKLVDFNGIFNDINHNNIEEIPTSKDDFNSIYLTKEKKEYNKKTLKFYLEEKRSCNIYFSCRYNNYISAYYNSLTTLLYPLTQLIGIYFSTYTLGLNNSSYSGFLYLLCIKQEYIHYVKLCSLTGTDPEFDCFYILAIKDGYSKCTANFEKRMYNSITKLIKAYSIPVYYVNSIEEEISKIVQLPKFNTIRDYNNWLVELKNKFLNSCKEENKELDEVFIIEKVKNTNNNQAFYGTMTTFA